MLKLLHRTLFYRTNSLKTCVYTRLEDVEWFKNKLYSDHRSRDRLVYLEGLEQKNVLNKFFSHKTIDMLNEEEIFYLLNSGADYKLSEKGRQELLAKISSTYFKCLVAKEFRWLNEIEQYLIVLSFNETIFQMDPWEICFCLDLISQFQGVRQQLDHNLLAKKLSKYMEVAQHAHNMILACGYLLEMGVVLKEILTSHHLANWMSQNQKWDFCSIYFAHKLTQKLEKPLTQKQKEFFESHMKQAIQKLQFHYFESNYLVFLLHYYPKYVKQLSISHFTPRAYLGYLQFYKLNPTNKIGDHKIPKSVIELTDITTFRDIIEYRMSLGLDNALTLAKFLPQCFVHSLKPVNCFLTYIKDNKIEDLQVQFYIEKAVESKMRLTQQFMPQLTKQYAMNEVITMFTLLSRQKLCSVDFWKRGVRWLERAIDLNRQNPFIQQRNQTYVNLLHLITLKNFKESTRIIVYGQLVKLLENSRNFWPLWSIGRLTRVLSSARIGQDQIWLLIQRKLDKYLHKQNDSRQAEQLVKIVLNFDAMQKGSFKFWNGVNQVLDPKSKKEILNKTKKQNSIAKMHLNAVA